MKQTMTEKILAAVSGNKSVSPGQLIWADVDVLMIHDPCTPGVISVFRKHFGENARVWDRNRLVMIPDHFVFSADAKANENIRIMREFAEEQGIVHFYDVGTPNYKGVCHIALPEGGHTKPGKLLVGTDSHTVTAGAFGQVAIGVGITDGAFTLGTGKILLKVPQSIKIEFNGSLPANMSPKDLILQVVGDLTVSGANYCAVEFCGSFVEQMNVEERMTICNMVTECGGKNAIIAPNSDVIDFLENKGLRDLELYESDRGASYRETLSYDVSKLQPLVAKPHSPDNVDLVANLRGTKVDRAYLGSCTGGKTSDFVEAARILRGKKAKVETFAVPATRDVLQSLMLEEVDGESVFKILLEAGVNVSFEPGCAACCGGPCDTFGRANGPVTVISSTNRNFPGRMGHKEARIYLASPATVAATAIAGEITDSSRYA